MRGTLAAIDKPVNPAGSDSARRIACRSAWGGLALGVLTLWACQKSAPSGSSAAPGAGEGQRREDGDAELEEEELCSLDPEAPEAHERDRSLGDRRVLDDGGGARGHLDPGAAGVAEKNELEEREGGGCRAGR